MKFNDIKLVEFEPQSRSDYSQGPYFKEPIEQRILAKWCRGIRNSFKRDKNFSTTDYSRRTIAAARNFAKTNPEYSKGIEACIAGGGTAIGGVGNADTGLGSTNGLPGNSTTKNGNSKNGNSKNGEPGTTKGGGDSSLPGADKGGIVAGPTKIQKAADQLEGLINAEDWAGAKALLDGDPDLKALWPAPYYKMIEAAVQADIDAAKAIEDAKAAKKIADAKAAEKAAEEAAELAKENKRLADLAAAEAAEAARLQKIADDAAAAKKAEEAAKAQAEADAKEAEAKRIAAAQKKADEEAAEAARIAAEEKAAAEKAAAEKEAEKNNNNDEEDAGDNEEFDWEKL